MIQHSRIIKKKRKKKKKIKKKKKKESWKCKKKKLPNKTNMKSLHLMHEHIYTML